MCNIVEVFRADSKKRFCETKAELREAIGSEPMKSKQYKTWDDGDCLCPCDMKATAKAAGFVLRTTGGMEYMMTVKHATPNLKQWSCGAGRRRRTVPHERIVGGLGDEDGNATN